MCNRKIAFGTIALLLGTASGETAQDMSDGATWGGSVPADAVVAQEGTYTTTRDVSFNTFKITGGSNTFQIPADRTVSVTKTSFPGGKIDNGDRDSFTLTSGANDSVQTFSGGTWNLQDAYLGLGKYGTTTGAQGARLLFKDGVVVTNVGTLCVAGPYANPNGSTMTFTGEGTMLHLRKVSDIVSTAFLIGNPYNKDNVRGRLEILNGAKFYTGTSFYFDTAYSGNAPHFSDLQFIVSGEGTEAVFDAPLYMGWGWNTGNRIVFDDRARVTSLNSTFTIGYGSNTQPAVSNVVTVANGATFTATKGIVILGSTPSQSKIGHSYGNRFEVLSGATANISTLRANSGTARVDDKAYADPATYTVGDGTHDNSVCVSNAALTVANDICVGYGAYTYNGLLEAYDNANIECYGIHAGYGGTSAWNRVSMNGATVKARNVYAGSGVGACGNVVALTNVTLKSRYVILSSGANGVCNRMSFDHVALEPYDASTTDPVSVFPTYGSGTASNVFTMTDTTFANAKAELYLPGSVDTAVDVRGNTFVLDNVAFASGLQASALYMGNQLSSRDNVVFFRNMALPVLTGFFIGGTNNAAVFENASLVIASGGDVSGIAGSTSSYGASMTFRGAAAVLTVTNTSDYLWGRRPSAARSADYATLSLEDGAELRLNDPTHLVKIGSGGSEGSRIRVHNAKLASKYLILNGNGSSFEMGGPDCDVAFSQTMATTPTFADASNCVYRVTDGARLALKSYNFYFCFNAGQYCQYNTLLVDHNGVFDMADCISDAGKSSRDLMVSYWGASQVENIHDNTVRVESGGVITNVSAFCFAHSSNNKLILDGGSLYCSSITMTGSAILGTNEAIVVRGRGSRLVIDNYLQFPTNAPSTFRFEVPAGGYDEPPVFCRNSFGVPAGNLFEIDLSQVTANLKDRVSMTLVKSNAALAINASVLAATQANVDRQLAAAGVNGRLELSADRKSLLLTVAPIRGLVINLR